MELYQLFKIQDILENKIKSAVDMDEHALGKDNVFDLRFLAFQVKLGEIANLTKCYKYTKAEKVIPREKLLFRYVDAMQFLLSIGNTHDFNIIDDSVLTPVTTEEHTIKLFSWIYEDITHLRYALGIQNYGDALSVYLRLFSRYISLGRMLGFTFEEVYHYYLSNYAA
ncbi:dimeric dUTPase (all-alpha-NTP-PPase superfamily) [Anaerosolibacter carboniphilus]|uniref:Dimeric dUTPase (All-alpha-NTP-PPase superfamily) n=1 Tax=Anaerosolibacter carboniphilus TaxID=1417629 RepID=A0A841KVI1_9FIRM|nr:dUTP diphosphatase [Anaerosolibacter carboniphilus]MBB6217676.1 dimeric dUTPase (all-alpha-NTP-PPase superfamily) [Anaerosolibacter carboniphilus]